MPSRMNMVMNSNYPTKNGVCVSDSPFSNHSSFVLYLEPIYNSFLQIYQNVITLDCIPNGTLANMVTLIRFPKLSSEHMSQGESCVPVLLRYPVSKIGSGSAVFKWKDGFMYADDIPSVFSYLHTHGYVVDTATTNMLQGGRVLVGGISDIRQSGNRRMIAMVSTIPA